ncbi:MAG: molybdate ABC transporter substrate-binding protein [Pseudomonadota bacterium]
MSRPNPWCSLWRKVLAALALVALCTGSAGADGVPKIAAASDLKFALDEIVREFGRRSGRQVKIVYGSSGNLVRQIAQGAPFQMFLSADEDFVLQLEARGLTVDRGELYAIGRLALVIPKDSPLQADASLQDLSAAIGDGRLAKFAIANPEHAPYGRAAREVLQHVGLWQKLQGRLVLGENVSQAMQFALSGSTQGGIVAYSLALSPQPADGARHALLPAEWHKPLRQRMVLMRNADGTTRAFYDFLRQPAAREVFRRNGFLLPGEG